MFIFVVVIFSLNFNNKTVMFLSDLSSIKICQYCKFLFKSKKVKHKLLFSMNVNIIILVHQYVR